jgi:hypothetical protein
MQGTGKGFTLRPFSTFAQFAEPVAADLADLRKLARPLSASATFQHDHFCQIHGLQFFIEKIVSYVAVGSRLLFFLESGPRVLAGPGSGDLSAR